MGEDIVAASGSRDTTVKIWSPISGVCHRTFVGHEHFVAAVTSLPVNDYFPVPSIASAGNDKIINVWYERNHPNNSNYFPNIYIFQGH